MTGPAENDADDDFLVWVRGGGLEDSPPEIAAEVIRLIRETTEIFERYGVTAPGAPAAAPIGIQRAMVKDVKKLMRKPGPKRPELRPGQFERDLYLTVQVHKRCAEGEKIERAFEDVATEMGEKVPAVRKRYYHLRHVSREWLEKEGRLEELEEWQKKEVVSKRWEKYLTG